MASAKEIMLLKYYLNPQVTRTPSKEEIKEMRSRRNPTLDRKHLEETMKPIYERKLVHYKPGKFVDIHRQNVREMREDAATPWDEDDERRDEVAWYRDYYKEKREKEMAGSKKNSESIRERQKRVRKQNELARQQDKIHPFETYQSNEMGGFPFGGYSEDTQLRSNGTRQGRKYNLENRLPASGKSSVSEARKWVDNKKKNTKTRRVLENAFNRKK